MMIETPCQLPSLKFIIENSKSCTSIDVLEFAVSYDTAKSHYFFMVALAITLYLALFGKVIYQLCCTVWADNCIISINRDREQTDREQRRLAEKGDPKYIFTIPKAILPKPSLCDETTATKSVTKSCNGQLTWLGVT